MNFNLVAEIAVNGSEMASSSVMERSALEARHLAHRHPISKILPLVIHAFVDGHAERGENRVV